MFCLKRNRGSDVKNIVASEWEKAEDGNEKRNVNYDQAKSFGFTTLTIQTIKSNFKGFVV